jgi:hypothetical protein
MEIRLIQRNNNKKKISLRQNSPDADLRAGLFPRFPAGVKRSGADASLLIFVKLRPLGGLNEELLFMEEDLIIVNTAYSITMEKMKRL